MASFLTAGIDPVAARFREQLGDFVVDELPAYEPAGEGTHTYLWIEKRGLPTLEAVRRLARALGKRPRDVGYAGLKDARGVTRQYLSIEHIADEAVAGFSDPAIEVLRVERHRNKLKKGHLRGNRFRIRLRGLDEAASERAERGLGMLARLGAPNGFGPQRFGGPGAPTAAIGFALLRGDGEEFLRRLLGDPASATSERVREARACYEAGDLEGARHRLPQSFAAERVALEVLIRGGDAARAARRIPRSFRSLYVSAAQSLIFNQLLAARLEERRFGRVEVGDRAFLHNKGAVFLVEDEAAEQERVKGFEISAAGPLFGTRMLVAGGETAVREAAALGRHGVAGPHPQAFEPFPRGDHRPYRIPVADLTVERVASEGGAPASADGPDGPLDLVVSFALPRGAYATSVLREVFKRDVKGWVRSKREEKAS
ncbi:MAG: tRNA pseudouridine(13) synthase TruD [Planctomycetota bacterium]